MADSKEQTQQHKQNQSNGGGCGCGSKKLNGPNHPST